MNVSSRPQRAPGISLQPAGPELLVHDTRNAKVHVLNASAGRILTLCDGDHDVASLVAALVDEWSIDAETARADVGRALDDFAGRGLLTVAD